MANHLIDNEANEFFAEIGIELGGFGQCAQAGDLALLAPGIAGGQAFFRLVGPHRLGDAEAFGEHVDQRGVDIVNRGAEAAEDGVGCFVRHPSRASM